MSDSQEDAPAKITRRQLNTLRSAADRLKRGIEALQAPGVRSYGRLTVFHEDMFNAFSIACDKLVFINKDSCRQEDHLPEEGKKEFKTALKSACEKINARAAQDEIKQHHGVWSAVVNFLATVVTTLDSFWLTKAVLETTRDFLKDYVGIQTSDQTFFVVPTESEKLVEQAKAVMKELGVDVGAVTGEDDKALTKHNVSGAPRA